MTVLYRLTPELRKRLKKPIGTLIRGSFEETIVELNDLLKKQNPSMIISVGDVVSRNLTEGNMFPKLCIVDNKVMRKRIQPIALVTDKTLYAKNPPGTITQEALETIQEALEHNHRVKIIVDGEEDLLTLAAILYAPENSFVVYGQPIEGTVVVPVSKQKKKEITEILRAMQICGKPK